MQPNQTLSGITARVLVGVEQVLQKEKPDVVLVHGDTTTALASTLAAFYNQIKIGHVEAGLRTYDKYSPFPEEINRQTIDRMADYLFAPTETSAKNLSGCLNKDQQIFITGNTAIDALKDTVLDSYTHPILDWIGQDRFILLTAHRRENLGQSMRQIFLAVRQLTDKYPDLKVIYPIHLNPKVREAAKEILSGNEQIRLIEPLDVIDFHNFMEHSYLIMTDSGGVQEEAPSLGKPVLVLRDTTERPEGIEAGTLRLTGTKTDDIVSAASELLSNSEAYKKMAGAKNPYGDGHASERIVQAIIKSFDIK